MIRGFDVASTDGGHLAVSSATLTDLENRLEGDLLCAGDEGWEDAVRIWNGMAAKRPALVIQPTTAQDVATAVDFARDLGLLLSVKGGGHNIAGTAIAEGGVMLDMSRMREVTVDPGRGSLRSARGAGSGTSIRLPRSMGWRPRSGSSPRRVSPA